MTDQPMAFIPPYIAENVRRNIWIFRTYLGLSRKQMISGPVKAGTIRNYEHGFAPIHSSHLPIIAAKLSVSVADL